MNHLVVARRTMAESARKVFKRPSNISQTVFKTVMYQQTKRFYGFDGFRIDLTERALRRGGELAPLL